MLRFLLVIGLLAPVSVRADARGEDDEISIERLIEVAVRRSSRLAFVRSERRRAGFAVQTAGAGAQWRVQATVGVDRQHDAAVATAGARQAVLEDTSVTGTLGVAKQIVTGADLSVSVDSIRRSRQTDETSGMTSATAASSLGIAIRQPLLRGRAQGAHVDQHKATLAANAIDLQSQDGSAALVLDLLTAYWELAYAHASLAVRQQSLLLAQSQLDLTRKMHERGTVPDSAIKSARYGVALREEARLRAQDAVQRASLQLRKLAGLEIATDIGDLWPGDPLIAVTVSQEADEAVAAALARNPRIAAARMGIQIAEVELRRRRNSALPALDVSANATAFGVGQDRGDAFSATTTGSSYQIGGNLSFSWEIGGAASAAAEAARIDKTEARLTAKDVERDVIADVIDVVRRLSAAKQRAVVAERAIELATANLDTEVALFRADKSSNVLVFERQTEVDEARLLASRAAADSLIASATLDYLTGNLLDRYGVEIVPSSKGARNASP